MTFWGWVFVVGTCAALLLAIIDSPVRGEGRGVRANSSPRPHWVRQPLVLSVRAEGLLEALQDGYVEYWEPGSGVHVAYQGDWLYDGLVKHFEGAFGRWN